jgi:hypothetical protein
MEGMGWSENFVVVPNQITTLSVPLTAMNTENQTIVEKGIYIETQDTVAVYSSNLKQWTGDGAKILPVQSLGTEYRVTSYQGLQNNGSQFMIVATEDGTEVEITPADNMMDGEAAGVPFIVQLDRGETYYAWSTSSSVDYTGTLIKGTEANGDCRPFAV